ncbi:hypothetical protein [Rubrivivax gelatinosus]|uniref:Uncharacterized protein n=1 Tax=Rubrivivax gelatinosus (strain NBRC 100245 / IL144) TaxID=983917 RepID=I0HW71_RUBGI|nr:hypothetical protein [Rubrivivax gelatinosus]BAL97258.1 hypothetical protein RGE_39220 [Rubrivivax gelatinosus IL144]
MLGLLLTMALPTAQAGGEDRSHDELGHSITTELHQRLVAAGLCPDINECRGQSRVLFVSSRNGLHFELYDVTQAEAIGAAFEVLGRRGRELPAGKRLKATFISHSKAADLRRARFSKQPVHAKIEVEGAALSASR